MDLSTIKPNTLKVEIYLPGSSQASGLTVECASRSDPAVKKLERQNLDRNLARQRSNRKLTAIELEERAMEMLATRVVGLEWKGDASWSGKKLEPTPENVRLLLEQDWLKRQVEEAISQDDDFFQN